MSGHLNIYSINDTEEKNIIACLKKGEYTIGRGDLLRISDKRVSRNHAVINISEHGIDLTSKHQNACFYIAAKSKTITVVKLNESVNLNDYDKFGLLPDTFWFKVRTVKEPEPPPEETKLFSAGTNNNEQLPATITSPNHERNKRPLCYNSQDDVENKKRKISNPSDQKIDANEMLILNQLEMEAKHDEILENRNIKTEAPHDEEITEGKPEVKVIKKEIDEEFKQVDEFKTEENEIKHENLFLHNQEIKIEKASQSLDVDIEGSSEQIDMPIEAIAGTKAPNSTQPSTINDPNTASGSGIRNVLLHDQEIKIEKTSQSLDFNIKGSVEQIDEPDAAKDKPDSDQPSSQNDPDPASGSGATDNNKTKRERCWYGPSCYRKNPSHRDNFSHPGDADYDSDPSDDRPDCPFGAACYRKNLDHRRQYKHSNRPVPKPKNQDGNDAGKQKKKKRTATAKKPKTNDETPEDDYDLDDPFLCDDSEEEFEPSDDDDSDSDWEDSQEAEEDSQERKRLLKEAKRFTRANKGKKD